MPKGILTRFIVETHQSIEDPNNLWKNGVILADNWARAQVIENYPKKEINVRVSGSNKKPLLEIVRHELRKIHNSYERLEYKELIPCNCSKCKSSPEPESYAYDLLTRYKNEHKYTIECRNSFEQVDVRRLITDITDHFEDELLTRLYNPSTPVVRDPKLPKPKPAQVTDVFISYAIADGAKAAQHLREALADAGFSVWQDIHNLRGGEDWKEQLRDAIRNTKAVLVLLTPSAVKSEYVKLEYQAALALGNKKLIPVSILNCDVPDELQRLQNRNLSEESSYLKGLLAIIKDLNAIK